MFCGISPFEAQRNGKIFSPTSFELTINNEYNLKNINNNRRQKSTHNKHAQSFSYSENLSSNNNSICPNGIGGGFIGPAGAVAEAFAFSEN